MSEEELIEVLRQFDEKRVEELPEKTRNIFYAIMKIADERDELENIRKESIDFVNKMWLAKLTPDTVSNTKFELLNILNKGSENDVKKNNTNSN